MVALHIDLVVRMYLIYGVVDFVRSFFQDFGNYPTQDVGAIKTKIVPLADYRGCVHMGA